MDMLKTTAASVTMAEETRPMVSPFLQPDLDCSVYQKLGCDVHERCDWACNVDQPVIVKAVDISADSSLDGDEAVGDLRYIAALPARDSVYVPERVDALAVDPSLPTFQYTPLPLGARHFRLLKIKPAIFLADPIECELIDVPIDAGPIFDAVSYCWGPAAEWRDMVINGSRHRIQASLDDTLHRYRRLGSTPVTPHWKGKAEYVWADGVCIDQKNLEEKMEQVAMMQDVYQLARRIFVDLGPVPDLWICALDLMYAMAAAAPHLESRAATIDDAFAVLGLPSTDHIAWLALGYVLERPWFRRTWVVQEMAVPQRYPMAMFGRYSFDLGLFFKAVAFVTNRGYVTAIQAHADNRYLGFLNATKMIGIRAEYQAGTLRRLPMIERLRDFQATDPRDKVYGIMSLLEPRDRLVPDYRLSVEEVYTEFTVRTVERGDGGRMLDSAGLQRRLPGAEMHLPSWVVDWRAQERHPRVISTIRQLPYSACGHMSPGFVCFEAGDKLSTKRLRASAAIVDKIEYLGEVWESESGRDEFWNTVQRTKDLFRSGESTTPSRYPDPADAFARTLLMDDTYDTTHNMILVFAEISDPARVLDDILADRTVLEAQPANGLMDIFGTFQSQSTTVCFARRFAATRTGYFGLVPACAVEGDSVCVLAGSSVPHVLRPAGSEGEYQLVGDAYVHGIMYGEVVGKSDVPFKEVVLV